MAPPSARPRDINRRGQQSSGLLLVVAAGVLGILVPLLVVITTPPSNLPWQATTLAACWAGLRLAGLLAKGEPRLYALSIWTFVYVFLGLMPTIQMRLQVTPETTPSLLVAAQHQAATVVLIGIVALEVGALLARRPPSASGGYRTRVLTRPRVALFSAVTFGLCAGVVAATGVAPYFGSRDELSVARSAAFANPTVAGLAAGVTLAFPLVAFHALVLLRRAAKKAGEPPPLGLTTAAMLVVLLAMNNVVSSPRILFGTVILSLAVLAGAVTTPRRTRALVLAVVVGLTVVFPAADAFRQEVSAATISTTFDLRQEASSGDYDAFAQISNTIAVTDALEPPPGRQALGVALFFVPRQVWQDKPEDTGVLVANARGYSFTNLSAPIWAEGYINGGKIGVVIALLLVGFLGQRGDRAFARAHRGATSATVLGAILPFYTLIILRGSLLQATAVAVTLVVAVLAVGGREQSGLAD